MSSKRDTTSAQKFAGLKDREAALSAIPRPVISKTIRKPKVSRRTIVAWPAASLRKLCFWPQIHQTSQLNSQSDPPRSLPFDGVVARPRTHSSQPFLNSLDALLQTALAHSRQKSSFLPCTSTRRQPPQAIHRPRPRCY